MRYSLEPQYRRYVQGQGFMSFARNIGNKIAGKKVLTKSAEGTGDLIGNKIADRITTNARNKKQKEDDRIMEETQEIIIPSEKREQIIRDLNLF